MTAIYRERTARVPHSCGWDCGVLIKPGERYVMSSLTPNDNDIGNIHWWHAALHGRSLHDCPKCSACGTGMVFESGLCINCSGHGDGMSGS